MPEQFARLDIGPTAFIRRSPEFGHGNVVRVTRIAFYSLQLESLPQPFFGNPYRSGREIPTMSNRVKYI
jgi:hypothetical protein